MASSWRDPADNNLDRRMAREVTGYRGFDPLRQMSETLGGVEHHRTPYRGCGHLERFGGWCLHRVQPATGFVAAGQRHSDGTGRAGVTAGTLLAPLRQG